MALTWLTKTKQYFTTKVFTEDRFRTNDRPTEAEYSNLFQSIVFKVHDLATTLLSGIVRKATKLDFLLGKDQKPTTLSGYTHNDPLYVSPALMQEFIIPAGSIISWIPYRAFNRITGERFADNAGTILDTGFLALGVGTTITSVSNADWYNTSVVSYFETHYLSPRYRICDNRVITFINPYTNLNETTVLPDMRGRVTRGAREIADIPPMQDNQGLFRYGGSDVQNLSHTHTLAKADITNIQIDNATLPILVANLPAHNHQYVFPSVSQTTSTITVQSGSGATFGYVSNVSVTPVTGVTADTGGSVPTVHNHSITASDIETSIENPLDPFFADFSEVDNRQRYFNTYYIIAIY